MLTLMSCKCAKSCTTWGGVAGGSANQAFGVDPSRARFYSLRQSRYDALAQDISGWSATAAARGRKLAVLDVGCAWGVLARHLQSKPHFDNLLVSATDITDSVHQKELYHEFFLGDLTQGYPQIPSNAFDVVVCEQVLEHLPELDAALGTLVRLTKPGGKLVVGVPIFLPPLHLVRKHLLPAVFKAVPVRNLGTHDQAFSYYSFLREIGRFSDLKVLEVRGFRFISGGLLRPLENYRWWWRLNRRLGKLMPAACIEIQAILEKVGEMVGHTAAP
jgi:2-polyprenyl-3-methyl-5-hydroxy-6-metoxy-1,4-benzoquinol methylase